MRVFQALALDRRCSEPSGARPHDGHNSCCRVAGGPRAAPGDSEDRVEPQALTVAASLLGTRSPGVPRRGQRANAADLHVAMRIHECRIALGLTQPEFARMIGISFVQLGKHERGTDRISAGRLWLIAEAANLPIETFFEDLAAPDAVARPRTAVLKFMRSCAAIENLEHVKMLLSMSRHFGTNRGQEEAR